MPYMDPMGFNPVLFFFGYRFDQLTMRTSVLDVSKMLLYPIHCGESQLPMGPSNWKNLTPKFQICQFHTKNVDVCIPIGSMGRTIYLPEWLIFMEKCRHIYHTWILWHQTETDTSNRKLQVKPLQTFLLRHFREKKRTSSDSHLDRNSPVMGCLVPAQLPEKHPGHGSWQPGKMGGFQGEL